MGVNKIHHINFLVEDLKVAITKYRDLLGIDGFICDRLTERGVITARVAIGEQWLVLVQPTDSTGIAGQHLAKHGEGFFLMSFAVDSLKEASARVLTCGATMAETHPRQGLDDWQVHDINAADTMGVQLQFCMEGSEKT